MNNHLKEGYFHILIPLLVVLENVSVRIRFFKSGYNFVLLSRLKNIDSSRFNEFKNASL